MKSKQQDWNNRKLTRRDMLKLAGTTAAGALLAACTPAAPAQPSAGEPAATEAVVAQAPAGGEPVKLKFVSADLGSGVLEWLEGEATTAFKSKMPNVEFEFISTDWGKINEQLLASFAGGDVPDLFEHGSSASGASWAASGQTLALDNYFSSLPTKDDYFQVALDTAYYQGKLYSMPRLVQPTGLIYRKDYFEEAGLDPAAPPTTWDELREMAVKLTKTEGGNMTRAGYWVPVQSWNGVQMGWFPYVFQNGSGILNDEMTQVAFDDEKGIEAMTFYHDLLWKDKVDVVGGLPVPIEGANPVLAGVAAMGVSDINIISQINKNFPEMLEKLAVAKSTQKEKQATLLGVSRTFIAKESKNPDAAWAFLTFLHEDANFQKRFELFGHVPPTKSFLNSDAVKSQPILTAFLENVEIGVQWPATPKWNDFRSFITSMSDGFLAQEGAIDSFVHDAAKEINAQLQS